MTICLMTLKYTYWIDDFKICPIDRDLNLDICLDLEHQPFDLVLLTLTLHSTFEHHHKYPTTPNTASIDVLFRIVQCHRFPCLHII